MWGSHLVYQFGRHPAYESPYYQADGPDSGHPDWFPWVGCGLVFGCRQAMGVGTACISHKLRTDWCVLPLRWLFVLSALLSTSFETHLCNSCVLVPWIDLPVGFVERATAPIGIDGSVRMVVLFILSVSMALDLPSEVVVRFGVAAGEVA